MKQKLKALPKPEVAAKEWIDLHTEKLHHKAETARLEKRMGELKEVLEPYLEKQTDQAAEMFGWRLKLVESKSVSLDREALKEALGEDVLEPFTTEKPYTFIKPTFQGGEAEAAA